MYEGFLVVNKEKGFTSHDVVAKLRGILKMKKIGHAGTLDPYATGVLTVCLGRATKFSSKMMESDKEYRVQMMLGQVTDTQDTSGKILEQKDTANITADEVREMILSFEGGYDQIPPMYSAKKVNGKKLYEYAREGIEVEREPERVNIYDISIDEIELPYARFTVTCSKGTYIRTLCHDIGQKLGCGACMSELERTKASGFTLDDAHTLDEIEQVAKADKAEKLVVPIADRFEQEWSLR